MSKDKFPLNEKDLAVFKTHLSDNLNEIEKIESKLSYIIKRNSIVDIAAKVEVYQLMLDRSFKAFADLKFEIERISNQIKLDDVDEIQKKSIQSVRKKMIALPDLLAVEDKKFTQVKANCNHFIADILK